MSKIEPDGSGYQELSENAQNNFAVGLNSAQSGPELTEAIAIEFSD